MNSGGVLSVEDLGAQGNNQLETVILKQIFANNSGNIILPQGIHVHDDVIIMNDNTILDGVGEIRAIGTTRTAIVMGNNCTIKNIRVSCTATTRQSNMESSSILIYDKYNCTIENVQINGSASGGIMIVNSKKVNVTGCSVRSTLADGIHVTGGSEDVYVNGNTCEETGDDSYAVVSYQRDGNLSKNVRFEGNYSYHCKSRGIAIVGGMNIEIVNNQILECKNAGIYIAQENSFSTYGSENITALSNRIISANKYNPEVDYAGIHIAADNEDFPCKNISIQSNFIYQSNWKAILVDSKNISIKVSNVDILNNDIDTNSKFEGIGIFYGKDVRINYNKIKNIMKFGIYAEGNSQCGLQEIIGNYIENVNLMADRYVDGITTFVPGTNISYNTIVDTGNRLERAIEADLSSGSTIFGNRSIGGKPIIYNKNSMLVQTRRIVEGTSAPSTGTWTIGDEIINISPVELGTSTKKYIVDKWKCVASGTPGRWKQCRVLTGA